MRFNTAQTRKFAPQTAKTIETAMFEAVADGKVFSGSAKVSRKAWRKAARDTIDALSLNYEMKQGVYTVYAPKTASIDLESTSMGDYEVVCMIEHTGQKSKITYVLPRLTAKSNK